MEHTTDLGGCVTKRVWHSVSRGLVTRVAMADNDTWNLVQSNVFAYSPAATLCCTVATLFDETGPRRALEPF